MKMNFKLSKIKKELTLGAVLLSLLAFVLIFCILILPAIDRCIDRNMPLPHYIKSHSGTYFKAIGELSEEELETVLSHSADSIWDVYTGNSASYDNSSAKNLYASVGGYEVTLDFFSSRNIGYLKKFSNDVIVAGCISRYAGSGVVANYFLYSPKLNSAEKKSYSADDRKVLTVYSLSNKLTVNNIHEAGFYNNMQPEAFYDLFNAVLGFSYQFKNTEQNDDYYLLADGIMHVIKKKNVYTVTAYGFNTTSFTEDIINEVRNDYFSAYKK